MAVSLASTSADVDDIDYSDLEEQYAVTYESPLDHALIVDGLPIVGEDKAEKLLGAFLKAIKKASDVSLEKSQVVLPTDESGSTKGFAFLTLVDPQQAASIASTLDGYAFDKRHTFSVIPFSRVDEYTAVPDTFDEPAAPEFVERQHFKSWLADPAARDQFVTIDGETARIAYLNRGGTAYDTVLEAEKYSDSFTQWSPLGSFLATIHLPGVALHGGADFKSGNRFSHPDVKLIDFSPLERYLVTCSPRPIQATPNGPFTAEDEDNHIAIWDTHSGALLRTFPMVFDPDSPTKRVTWPMFKWSPDEKYVARVIPGTQISVYETPAMTLLNKKSLKIDGVAAVDWVPLNDQELESVEDEIRGGKLTNRIKEEAEKKEKEENKKKKGPAPAAPAAAPRENTMVYWTPEVDNQPARVTVMHMPSQVILRSKNLFNVDLCTFYFQSSGDYLCVKVDRHTKTRKTRYCNLELFRLRQKDYPVQVIESKDPVIAFAWEPRGDRFAIVTTSDPNYGQPRTTPGAISIKTSVSFYGYDARKGDFVLISTLDTSKRTTNSLFWSPKGRHIVLATLGVSSKSDLEFWDLDLDKEGHENEPGKALKMIADATDEYGLTEIEWDATGRHLAAIGSTWSGSPAPGFSIFDFRGIPALKHKSAGLKQVLFRPKPPLLLTKDEQKRIRRSLREYSKKYDELDAAEDSNVSAEIKNKRERAITEWNAWRAAARARHAATLAKLGRVESQEDQEQEEVEGDVEEQIGDAVTEEVVL